MTDKEQIWSVSEVNRAVREILEESLLPFWLAGEVGSLVLHRSGHVYLTLKDERCQIRASCFGGVETFRRLGVQNGTRIECWGNLSVYEVRGEYQFNIKKVRLAGLGDLQRRFEELKRKLDAEGLFDSARKKPVPALPRIIGVVSSPDGAAVRDFLRLLDARFPNVHVRIYPAVVQGAGAAESVARGIEFFNRNHGADVLVVTRGGGSMEDLWPFNEERLVRAVAASSIPVVSAVGHEIDFTLCDFASDVRVPTPSAAAELVIGEQEMLRTRVSRCEKDLQTALIFRKNDLAARLERAAGSFVFREPGHVVEMKRQQIDELENSLFHAAGHFMEQRAARLDRLTDTLNALNPARQLQRGYAILTDPAKQKIVTSKTVAPGTELEAILADGRLPLKVR